MSSRRRSTGPMLAGAAVAFAVCLGGFLALGATPEPKPHVHIPRPHLLSSGIPATSQVAREFARDNCTIVWSGRAGNQDWHTRANWIPARIPGPDDIACVPAGSKVTIKHDVKVKGFVNHGDLTIAGGKVDFGNAQNG